jgi:hypothetical protein
VARDSTCALALVLSASIAIPHAVSSFAGTARSYAQARPHAALRSKRRLQSPLTVGDDQPMSSRSRIATIGSCLAVLMLAPAAHAGLPVFKNTEIVINKSFAGVTLGGTVSSAKKAWGKPTYCDATYCDYRKARQDISTGEGSFAQRDGTVFNAQLTAPRDADFNVIFKKPITEPKTSKGIGIGSTKKQFLKAYPKAKDLGGGSAYLIKKGKRQTQFNVDAKSKRIFSILMADTALANP